MVNNCQNVQYSNKKKHVKTAKMDDISQKVKICPKQTKMGEIGKKGQIRPKKTKIVQLFWMSHTARMPKGHKGQSQKARRASS